MRGGCQKPRCGKEATETYTGKNDNTLRLCEGCYYNLVTGRVSVTHSPTLTPANTIGTNNTSNSWPIEVDRDDSLNLGL